MYLFHSLVEEIHNGLFVGLVQCLVSYKLLENINYKNILYACKPIKEGIFLAFYTIFFWVVKQLYNLNFRPYVCNKLNGGNVILSAAIQDRRLIFLVKISCRSRYNVLDPSVYKSCYKRQIHILYKKVS